MARGSAIRGPAAAAGPLGRGAKGVRAAAVVGVVAGLTAIWAVQAFADDAGTRATTVVVTEKEWAVTPSLRNVPAGRVAFRVRNVGKLAHEFVVIRTNRRPGALPVVGQKAVVSGLVGSVGRFKPGDLRGLGATLRPGRYVLLCNLPGHYRAGQFAGFRVR